MAYYKNSVGPTVQFRNLYNDFNRGSGQGMAAGASFGPWGMLIGAAIGGTLGAIGNYFHNKEAYKQGKQQLKMAKTANSATLTEMGRNISQINRQRTILSMQTQSALMYAQAQGRAQNASNAALYAAADQVGNQALYLQSAVRNMVDEQQYQSMFNLQTQQLNLNVQVQDLANTVQDRFVGVNVQGGDFSIGQALTDLIDMGAKTMQNYQGGGGGSAPSKAGASTTNANIASMAPSNAKIGVKNYGSTGKSVFDIAPKQSFNDWFWKDQQAQLNKVTNNGQFGLSSRLGLM